MKRRHFFSNISLGVAGLSIAGSCTNHGNGNTKTVQNNNDKFEIPVYREKIKPDFKSNNTVNSNDKVVLALIGAGNWGTNLILTVTDINKNVEVKYVCDVDDTRGGRAIKELEKKQNLKPIRVRDMRRVFDDKDVDAVIIATPQHWHALATIWACQAGKDVYVEKSISYNIREGQKMIEAAMKYERVVQCGMQNRSADFAFSARNYVQSGKLGKIFAVNVYGLLNGPVPFREKENSKTPDTIDWDMWLGPAPKVPYNVSRNKSSLFYWDYSGGNALGNDAIHQMDLMRFVLGDPGFPGSAYCTGGRFAFDDNREIPDYQMVTYDYGGFVLTLQAGDNTSYMSKTKPAVRFGDRFPVWQQNSTRIEIYGTKRKMFVGRMGGGWQVYEKDNLVVAQETGKFPLKVHMANFIDCVRSRQKPNADIVEGHRSTVLIHLANLSYRAGKKQLMFSQEYEAITNNQKAQDLALGTYRKGYEIPEIV
jgi:predicted dehydrogenase